MSRDPGGVVVLGAGGVEVVVGVGADVGVGGLTLPERSSASSWIISEMVLN